MARHPNLERMLVDNLPLVDRTVRWIAHRRGFSAEESDDFLGVVQLRLVENNYKIFGTFHGRSSLRSFLIVVIQRMALDYVIARTGKWRPSALARHSGEHAVRLEELILRRGMTAAQAADTMIGEPECTQTREQLLEIATLIPVRHRARRVSDDDGVIENVPDPETPHRALEQEAHVRQAAEIGKAFQRAFAGLRAEDRLLLKLRFESGLTVPQIAKSLRKRPRALYRRFDRLIRRLRHELAAAGLKPEGAAQWNAVILWVELWPKPADEGGETVARPSPSMEDEKV